MRFNFYKQSTDKKPTSINKMLIARGAKSQLQAKQYHKTPARLTVTAYNKETGEQVYVNDEYSVKLGPINEEDLVEKVIIGGAIKKKTFYYKVVVANLLPKVAALNWTSNGKNEQKYIPPYYFYYIIIGYVKAFVQPSAIKFNSYAIPGYQKLFTNDKTLFEITPVPKKELKLTSVFISSYVTQRTFLLLLKNPTTKDIHISWQTKAFQGSSVVPKQATRYPVEITTNGGYRNQKVVVKAKPNQDGDIVLNSNKQFITRLPYNKIITLDVLYKNIFINNTLSSDVVVSGPAGLQHSVSARSTIKLRTPSKDIPVDGLLLTAKVKESDKQVPINGQPAYNITMDDITTSLTLGGIPENSKKYFIRLWISNNNTDAVKLVWMNETNQSFPLPVNFNGEVLFSFDDDTPVFVSAIDAITKKPVYLNQRDELKFVPSRTNKYATSVVVNDEIYKYDYFYRLSVNNKGDKSIRIELRNGVERREAVVPGNRKQYFINTPLTNLKLGSKQKMYVYAFNDESNAPLYINNTDAVRIYPTLNEEDATVVTVDNRELPLELYYYTLEVIVPDNVNVILRYNLTDESKMSRIPKSSKYIVRIPRKSFKKPSNVEFIAVNEESGKRMTINGDVVGTMLASKSRDEKQIVKITPWTMIESNGNMSANVYYFTVIVSNPNFDDVTIMLSHSDQTRLVPANSRDVQFVFNISSHAAPKIVKLTAAVKNTPVSINASEYVLLKQNGDNVFKLDVLTLPTSYQVKMYVSNSLPIKCILKWKTHSGKKERSVSPNVVNQPVVLTLRGSKSVALRVTNAHGRPLSLNRTESISIDPPRDRIMYVVIGSTKYFYALNVENSEMFDVVVKWNEQGKKQSLLVKGLQSKRIIIENFDLKQPLEPVTFSAARYWRERPLLMHNNKTFTVYPVHDKRKVTGVIISSKPKDLKRMSFIALAVTNLVKNNVLLAWKANNASENNELIEAGASGYTLTIPFEYSRKKFLVKFTARIDGESKRININMQRSVFLRPKKAKKTVNIILTDKGT